MGEESAQKTGCKSYRKNDPTVPSGGGEKTLRAAKKRMQLTNQPFAINSSIHRNGSF